MRDIDAFLNSLVNIDRNSLVAILSSEAEAARQLITAARPEQHAAGLDRMLLFFQHGDVVPGMSQRGIRLCMIVEPKLRGGVSRETRPFPASTPNRIACGCKGRCNASSV